MIELERFRRAAQQPVRGDARIALTSGKEGQTGVIADSGRIARWVGRFRRSANRDVTSQFVASLRDRYGSDVANHLVRSTGMDRAMARGKPLRARHVAEIVGKADALRAAIVDRNTAVAAGYPRQVAVGSDHSLAQICLHSQSRKMFPSNPNMHLLVDDDRLSGMVESEIRAAGNNGAHFVTTGEAARILTRVVNRELQAAFETAQQGALKKLSFEDPDSISRHALTAALAGGERELNIDPTRFERDLNDALHLRIEDAAGNRLQAPAIDDEPALQALAGELMEGFVEERAAVREAVEALPIDAEAKEKILDQALHDNIRADMIPAMGRAYLQVRDDLAEVGRPLGSAELQGPLSRISDSMTSAFKESGVEVNVLNQDAMYRSFWRFLLAPGGEEQVSAIAGRMEHPGSALRAVGQGAAWFRNDFTQTEEGSQSVADENGREQPKYASSIDAASRYAVLMESLAKILCDKTDAPAESFGLNAQEQRLSSHEYQSDGAVAMLRNVGVAMPAPDRMGEMNPDAPVSRPALELIQAGIDEHVAKTASKSVDNGVLAEATRDFDRATYRVDGQDLARDPDAVARGLRVLCTDGSGRLNEEMLLGISKVAYQATPLSAYSVLFDPRTPETSLFKGSPVFVSGEQSLAYNLSTNDSDEVILNVRLSGPLNNVIQVTDDGNVDNLPLEPDRSHLELSMDLKLDASSFKPTIEAVNVGYSLFPGRTLPDQ